MLVIAWTRSTKMVRVVRIKMSITNIIKSLFKPSADVAQISPNDRESLIIYWQFT